MTEPNGLPVPSPLPAPTPRTNSWGWTLGFLLLLLIAAGAWYGYVQYSTRPSPPPDELVSLRTYIANLAQTQQLAAGYTDADGDLVADTPTDPAKLLKADEIGFSLVGSDDPEKAQLQWKDFMVALEKATGKKVKYLADLGSVADQTTALAEGRLHVTAFNTGQVPSTVNAAGFVPLYCPADTNGKYSYQMEILVPASSTAQKPEDLKGKSIGLVALSSHSGGKAPLVLLKEQFGMLPGRDYTYSFTGEHVRSVKELVAGKHAAVCVASDLLARAVANGEVKPEQFRTIYRSESFPPLCFGVPHNLPPEVLNSVRKTFNGFSFAGTTVGELYQDQGWEKFAPVNYQQDWKLIREVDSNLTRLLDGK